MALGAFATTTLLTKNSFLDEIRKQYVLTARMKGLTERQVLYGHVFRNAMLIVIAGFPGAFIGAFFAGSLLIETIFSLDGLGLLAFESIVNRDYPVVFANLYIFSLLGLVVNLLSDLTYTLDRSAHRLRDAGGLMATLPSRPARFGPDEPRRPASRRRCRARAAAAVADQRAAAGELQGQPARLLVVLDLPGALRAVPLRRVHRQRPADPGQLQGRVLPPVADGLSGGEVRRLPGRRPTTATP